jgi:hypothetical protein
MAVSTPGADSGALIVCGNGAELGNFRAFADDLKSMFLAKKFKLVEIVDADTREAFLMALEDFGQRQPIGELHIYTHAWGAGLAFGYKTSRTQAQRKTIYQQSINRKRKIGYEEVLNTEIGILFTDDLIRQPYSTKKLALRALFVQTATIKLWGCNSGVSSWVYSDADASGASVTDEAFQLDPANEAIGYWWRAINKQNSPKPAIAKALATYFDRPVLGAISGSSAQVFRKGTWISSDNYRKQTGRWPTEAQSLRLNPDKGNYKEFKP